MSVTERTPCSRADCGLVFSVRGGAALFVAVHAAQSNVPLRRIRVASGYHDSRFCTVGAAGIGSHVGATDTMARRSTTLQRAQGRRASSSRARGGVRRPSAHPRTSPRSSSCRVRPWRSIESFISFFVPTLVYNSNRSFYALVNYRLGRITPIGASML